MNMPKINKIWGIPINVLYSESSLAIFQEKSIESIKRQLHTFLVKEIRKCKPDFIIVIERKGTAILRSLKNWHEDPLDWPWSKVISSVVIDQMPDDYFRDKKILIFDEMMKTGIHIKSLLEKFLNRGLWNPEEENMHIAVFAVHEDSSKGILFKGKFLQYDWFYRDLTTGAYQYIRMQIVKMLQHAGSLMLDTEHIEVRIRLSCNLNQLIKALSRRSEVLVFNSSDQRTNITVFYKDDPAHRLPRKLFPKDINDENIVKKCRFIQSDKDEFAILPICYPSILKSLEEWPSESKKLLSDLFRGNYRMDEMGRFYCVALLAALEVLKWALKDLAVMGTDNYSISLPRDTREAGPIVGGYSLDHLLAMYPTLNIEELSRHISNVEISARKTGTRLRGITFKPYEYPSIYDEELKQDAVRLIQVIRYTLDQKNVEYRDYWHKDPPHPFGLQTKEIFDLGKKLGLDDVRISTLFDILIDEAFLVTHVQEVNNRKEKKRLARTFEPDGEIVSNLIRAYSNQWGLPDGF